MTKPAVAHGGGVDDSERLGEIDDGDRHPEKRGSLGGKKP